MTVCHPAAATRRAGCLGRLIWERGCHGDRAVLIWCHAFDEVVYRRRFPDSGDGIARSTKRGTETACLCSRSPNARTPTSRSRLFLTHVTSTRPLFSGCITFLKQAENQQVGAKLHVLVKKSDHRLVSFLYVNKSQPQNSTYFLY